MGIWGFGLGSELCCCSDRGAKPWEEGREEGGRIGGRGGEGEDGRWRLGECDNTHACMSSLECRIRLLLGFRVAFLGFRD
jgi:hypothetical protein